ncbi:MAG TPA: cyclodeaminase/cyclohydrolase family protein [Nocardioidaceae bacterium]|nr:cyclodeaminase/cyclohydrolase family protein [Nocardioidaceae bacterium]
MTKSELSTQTVQDLLAAVAAGQPAPAAGSAAAVTAALAAALAAKGARLSGRYLDDADRLVVRADELRTRALRLAEADADAIAAMGAAVRPASEDAPHDSTARDTVDDAIAVPREIGVLAAEVGELAVRLGEQGNPRLQADAAAAGHLADAAARTAAAIVRSNEGLRD